MINKNIFKIFFFTTSAVMITISVVTRRQYQRFHCLVMISGAIRLSTSSIKQKGHTIHNTVIILNITKETQEDMELRNT